MKVKKKLLTEKLEDFFISISLPPELGLGLGYKKSLLLSCTVASISPSNSTHTNKQ